ncbi:transporter associated domain-containing protein, partial [Kitasatospora sp. NPDC058263]
HAPDGPYETLAGLVSDLLGRLPVPGEQAELPGWRFTVEAVDRHRTSRVRVERTSGRPRPGDDEGGAR